MSAGHVGRDPPSFSLSVLLSVVLAPFLAWSPDGRDWSTDPLRSGSEQRKEMSGFFTDLKSSFLEALPASLSSSLKSYWPGIGLWSFLSAQTVFTQSSFGAERFGGVHSTRHLLSICAFD